MPAYKRTFYGCLSAGLILFGKMCPETSYLRCSYFHTPSSWPSGGSRILSILEQSDRMFCWIYWHRENTHVSTDSQLTVQSDFHHLTHGEHAVNVFIHHKRPMTMQTVPHQTNNVFGIKSEPHQVGWHTQQRAASSTWVNVWASVSHTGTLGVWLWWKKKENNNRNVKENLSDNIIKNKMSQQAQLTTQSSER